LSSTRARLTPKKQNYATLPPEADVVRVWISRLAYPVLAGGGLAGAWILLNLGVPLAWAVVAVAVVAAGCVIALERWLPFRQEWQRGQGDIPTDAGHLVASNVATEGLRLLMLGPLVAASAWMSRTLGTRLWPDHLPMAVQFLLALFIAELGGYWVHRLMHQRALLFRLHAAHHSAPRIYFLTGARNHAGEAILLASASLLPLTALGAGEVVLGLLGSFAGVHYMLQHANADIRLGPLKWVLNGPELHRWHHSKTLEEANANYGGIVLVWDWLFGTIFRPPTDRGSPIDVGLHELPAFPKSFLRQLAAPFMPSIWRR
jgi:sterol desaturase/sphingolipid hydroxylase (fatty acid hydroxylase superfamily)